jgi:hypothetical protein
LGEYFIFCSAIKILKIKIHKTIILTILCAYETYILAIKEQHGLRVFQNRVMRLFGPKNEGLRESGENLWMRNFVVS